MATREENIKKINDKLEQMSDEELDKVAGGVHFLIVAHERGNRNDQQNQPPQYSRIAIPI